MNELSGQNWNEWRMKAELRCQGTTTTVCFHPHLRPRKSACENVTSKQSYIRTVLKLLAVSRWIYKNHLDLVTRLTISILLHKTCTIKQLHKTLNTSACQWNELDVEQKLYQNVIKNPKTTLSKSKQNWESPSEIASRKHQISKHFRKLQKSSLARKQYLVA